MYDCSAQLHSAEAFTDLSVGKRAPNLWMTVIASLTFLLVPVCTVQSADEPSTPKADGTLPRGDGALPKYQDMELPTAEQLLKSKPFDWIVMKNSEVVVVEAIGPRPDTLLKLNADYERYVKGRAGMIEGEERLKDRRRMFQRVQITLLEPGPDQDPDYQVETRHIGRIEYFEDLILRRANLLLDEGKIPLAYDLLLFVERRNRENNVRLTEAYEARKQEEAAAKADDEHFRFSVPEQIALKLYKIWPKSDETYYRLLFKDAEFHSIAGDNESAVRLLENLWDHNSAYPGLPEALGQTVDRLVTTLVDKSDFRQARYFLGRLSARDPQHAVYQRWKGDLTNRTLALIEQARTLSSQGNGSLATNTIEQAARIWPDTTGLKEAHRELTDRHQIVRLGVLRLPGEPTRYPFNPPAETEAELLMSQSLFEPIRVDERGVRYRSTVLESWEPADLGRQVQFTLRLKRNDWEARPLITSADVVGELAGKIDHQQSSYDERLAGAIERISIQSPSQFTIDFRRLPLRLEALLQIAVSLTDESLALNPDLPPDAVPTAGRQRFYESNRDGRQVAYRRVRAQPATTKTRNVDEVNLLRYDSWERALQGLLRGEIAAIPFVNHRDLKALQEDNRFFVVPYSLPTSHFVLFNPQCMPLRDGQLRRALLLALPREEMIKKVVLPDVAENFARLTTTPFPTNSYGHNRLLGDSVYDPQRSAALALTAKKQLGELPVFRLACPPDPIARAACEAMIEHWRRVGISVRLTDSPDASGLDWDIAYRTSRIVEPLMQLWPMLAVRSDASVEALRPMPDRVRRQLLELERANDWTSATKILHRIDAELLVEARYIPLWEVDEFFVARRHLLNLPQRLMSTFQDVERWTVQAWFPQETP